MTTAATTTEEHVDTQAPSIKTAVETVAAIPLTDLTPAGEAVAVQDEDAPRDTEGQEPAEIDYPKGLKLRLIVLSTAFMILLAGLDANLVATAVPAITNHFHTVADIGWYYTGYKLPICSLQFFFGKMIQIFPIKRILVAAIVIFIVGSVLCAAATTSTMLILGRAVSGLGCAGAVACMFNMLTYTFPLRTRSLFMSAFGVIEMVSTVSGPLLGGVITEYLSWRWCFWILVPFGGLSLAVTAVCMPEIPNARDVNLSWKEKLSRLDLLGVALLVPAVTCLFIALGWAGIKYAWSSPVIIGLLVTSAVLLAAFICDQYVRGDDAAIPLRLLKNRDVIAGSIFMFSANASMLVIEYYMPTYFQAVHGFSPSRSGYQLLPIIAGSMTAFILGGSGISMIGYYKPFMIVGAILLPIAAGLVTTWKVETSMAPLVIYPALVGFGGSIGLSAPYSALQLNLSKSDLPLGTAVLLFSQAFGPAVALSMAQAIFAARLKINFERLVPGVDPSRIENLGLTDIKATLGAARLQDALEGFDDSLVQTWYLALGLSCVTIVGAGLVRWGSVKEKKS